MKKKKKKLTIKRELKIYKRGYYSLLIMFFILSGSILYKELFIGGIVLKEINFSNRSENYNLAYYRPLKTDYTYIKYDNTLSEEQKEKINKYLKEVNPLYYEHQRSILFTNDLCQYYDVAGLDIECNELLKGFNNKGGEIYLQYEDDESSFKIIFCHELLHTYIYPTTSDSPYKDKIHGIVYSLGFQQVCFNPEGKSFANPDHYLGIEEKNNNNIYKL